MEKTEVATPIVRKIANSGANIQYDEYVKRILSDKNMLAYLLKNVVEEFKNTDFETIRDKCIEGNIMVAKKPLDPGYSNTNSDITGRNTESKIPGEGLSTYDIIFDAVIDGEKESIKLIINVEAQKSSSIKALARRQFFYISRMVSAQKETEFEHSEYDKIKKVISIWICFNPAKSYGSSILRTSLQTECLCGNVYIDEKLYDLMGIVTINIAKDDEDNKNELLSMLSVVFGEEDVDVKVDKIRQCGIPVTETMEGGLGDMCNLSEVIKDRSKIETLLELFDKGILTENQFTEEAGYTLEEARKMLS